MISPRHLVLAAVLFSSQAAAQPSYPPRYDYGVSAGVGYSFHNAYATAPYHDEPGAVGGNGIGFAVGLVGERWFKFGGWGAAIVTHLEYQSMPASFERATRSGGFLVDSMSVEVGGRHVASASYGMVGADIMLRQPLLWVGDLGALTVMAGPSVSYIVKDGWEEVYTADEPGGVSPRDRGAYPVLDNGRTVALRDGSIANALRWRVGLRCGVGLAIRETYFYLFPSLTLDYGLTQVAKGSSWRAHALRLGIDIVPNSAFWWSLEDHSEDEDTPL